MVMTAHWGARFRNDRKYSHASATKNFPLPAAALEPSCGIGLPHRNVGSSPARERMNEIMADVVVFPWVPATAIPVRSAMSRPTIWG